VKPGEIYAVYLPLAEQTGTLDMSGAAGAFSMQWFNPRTGEFVGEAREIAGVGAVALGPVPSDPGEDWVVLIRKK
jgi:uncharacterized iron-regulated membrane protein